MRRRARIDCTAPALGRKPHKYGSGARPSKYNAKPTVVEGIRFASKKEARRYQELKLMEKVGEISNLVCQPEFPLVVEVVGVGPRQLAVIGKYIADFAYTTDKHDVFEDVKGMRTPLYRWKKKHVEAQYGITIREV